MGEPTSKVRNKEISEMFDYSFAQYSMKKILKSNVIGKYKVDGGKQEYASVVASEDVSALVKKGDDIKEYSYDVVVDNLKAPLKKDDRVGQLSIKKDDDIIRKIDLTISENIPKINLFQLFLRNVKNIVIGNMSLK